MNFFKRHYGLLGLTITVVIFICCKLPVLHTPYFWDELGVYVPGALKMKDNGTIGLLPSALEPLYSRGHPLLFYFCYASVYKLFGDSVAVGHTFAIMLGCATLIAFYLLVKNLWGTTTALIATILLSVQPIFFAMSGMVLPEMLLTFFVIIALWGLIRQRWWVYCLASSLAMLTKESALIIPATALSFLFFEGIVVKDFFSFRRFKAYLFAATPLFVYTLFLLIQKKENGWYFFPEHLGYIHFDSKNLHYWAGIALQDFFRSQRRWFETGFFILGLLLIFGRRSTPVVQKKTAIVSLLFLLFSFVFAITNFYLSRYILYVIPIVIMMGSCGIVAILENISSVPVRNILVALTVATGCILTVRKMDTGVFRDTSDMSYLHVVNCVQKSIDWTQQQPWRDSIIEAEFPVSQAISDTRNGYFSGKPFNHSVNFEKKAAYGLLFSLDDEQPPAWNGARFTVIKRFDDLFAHVSVVKYQ